LIKEVDPVRFRKKVGTMLKMKMRANMRNCDSNMRNCEE